MGIFLPYLYSIRPFTALSVLPHLRFTLIVSAIMFMFIPAHIVLVLVFFLPDLAKEQMRSHMSEIFLQANKVLLFSFLLCILFFILVLYKLISQASLKSFPTKQAWQRKGRKEDAKCLNEDFMFW